MKMQGLVLGLMMSLMLGGCPATKSNTTPAADGGAAGQTAQSGTAGDKSSAGDGTGTHLGAAGSSSVGGTAGAASGEHDGGASSGTAGDTSTAGGEHDGGTANAGSGDGAGTTGTATDCSIHAQDCVDCLNSMCKAELGACAADGTCKPGDKAIRDCICTAQGGDASARGDAIDRCVNVFEGGVGTLATALVDCASSSCGSTCGLK